MMIFLKRSYYFIIHFTGLGKYLAAICTLLLFNLCDLSDIAIQKSWDHLEWLKNQVRNHIEFIPENYPDMPLDMKNLKLQDNKYNQFRIKEIPMVQKQIENYQSQKLIFNRFAHITLVITTLLLLISICLKKSLLFESIYLYVSGAFMLGIIFTGFHDYLGDLFFKDPIHIEQDIFYGLQNVMIPFEFIPYIPILFSFFLSKLNYRNSQKGKTWYNLTKITLILLTIFILTIGLFHAIFAGPWEFEMRL